MMLEGTGESEVKDVVTIGLHNLTEGTKNPLSEYNTAFRRLQMQRRMTPVTDIPTAATLQSPLNSKQTSRKMMIFVGSKSMLPSD